MIVTAANPLMDRLDRAYSFIKENHPTSAALYVAVRALEAVAEVVALAEQRKEEEFQPEEVRG